LRIYLGRKKATPKGGFLLVAALLRLVLDQ